MAGRGKQNFFARYPVLPLIGLILRYIFWWGVACPVFTATFLFYLTINLTIGTSLTPRYWILFGIIFQAMYLYWRRVNTITWFRSVQLRLLWPSLMESKPNSMANTMAEKLPIALTHAPFQAPKLPFWPSGGVSDGMCVWHVRPRRGKTLDQLEAALPAIRLLKEVKMVKYKPDPGNGGILTVRFVEVAQDYERFTDDNINALTEE